MAAHQTPFTKAMSLDQLDDFFMSGDAPSGCMQLPDLDGFLTGIAAGPEIPPDEWWPAIWGEPDPSFADEEQAQAAIAAIMNHYIKVASDLEDEIIEPIFWEEDGVATAEDWAEGFSAAIGLRHREWSKMAKSGAERLMLPIMILCNAPGLLDTVKPEHRLKAIEDATAALPETVLTIAAYWRMSASEKRRFSAGLHSVISPGRNDPCPCGSGKKFKKCCGANG